MKDKEKIQCWCNNPDCGKELDPNYIGVCQHCGENAGKYCKPVAETVLGFKVNGNDKVSLMPRDSVDKDILKPKTEQPPKYLEQYCRMKRWYRRFQQLDQGIEQTHASEFYKDDVYAFFQNCYHLKDWIKKEKGGEVEKYIKSNERLLWCSDICNGSKHLEHKNRSGKGIKNGLKQHTHLHVGKETIIVVNYAVIAENDVEQDAFELATNCVKAWETFILDNLSETLPVVPPYN